MNLDKHSRVVEFVHSHPVFNEILDEKLLGEIAKQIENNEQEWPRVPEIYCHIIEGTRSNLETLELGLEFTIKNTTGQPKSDFINRLKDVENVGTIFEVCVLGALYKEFNNDLLPYPDIGNGQRVEAKLNLNGFNLFFEASVLNFSEADIRLFELARSKGGTAVTSVPGTGEGRVIQKIEEKFQRYKSDACNILLLSQYSCLPFHDCGMEAVVSYFHDYGDVEPTCNFCGIFYFDRYRCLGWIENDYALRKPCHNSEIISELKTSFKHMDANESE